MESKRIETFKDFRRDIIHGKKKQRLNEENLTIECEWYDRAIVEVMQRIESECFGSGTFDELVKYLKTKNQILDDTDAYSDDILVRKHIKELIWFYHGDSIVVSDMMDKTIDFHSIGLVISELSQVILDKIKEKKSSVEPLQKPTSKLVDRERTTMVPAKQVFDYVDDDEFLDDFDCESRRVMNYEKFSHQLNEAREFLKLTNYDECYTHSMTTIAKEVGSLQMNAILQFLKKKGSSKGKSNTIYNYVWKSVEKVVNKEGKLEVHYEGKKLNTSTSDMLKQVLRLYTSMIVEEILIYINEISGMTSETAK